MNDLTLADILADFSAKCALVAGDVMLDEYVWGEVRRISPEAPVPVVEIRRRTHTAGGAANTAANITSLGGRALLGGVVGRDYQAALLHEVLQERGVEPAGLVEDANRPTTTKTRIVAHNQQIVRTDAEQRQALPVAVESALLSWVEQEVAEVHAGVLSDYGKGVVSKRFAQRFIALARQAGKPVVVDPKGTDYVKYRGATVITPNTHEAELAVGVEIHTEAALRTAGRRLLDLLPGTAILITRGAQGMSLFRRGIAPVHIPTAARHVYDVTGAGDTVVGTLALALAADLPLEQAARLANHAAGIVVGKVGTAGVTAEELLGDETILAEPGCLVGKH